MLKSGENNNRTENPLGMYFSTGYTIKLTLLLVSERQGVFFRRIWGCRHIPSLRQLYEPLADGRSCMNTRRSPRPKKDESVLHMMSFFCILLRAFDVFCTAPGGLFLLHRVGHWWCAYLLLMQLFSWEFLLGRGPGLTLEYTWSFALRSCGTPLPAFLAL